MAEFSVTLHCHPCESCRNQVWQRIVDGRLRWDETSYCTAEGRAYESSGGGWGPPPPWIRERILAARGTVRLTVGGPDGIPLKAVRELYALTLPQLRAAREHGLAATPVEAELLRRPHDGPGD
ncbi:hypothetical protein ADK52_15140 [Streptomyces sp. WM6372]|uniref:hypothetical protein n=1 Tax=Streptomyces sp. WM6372 TaxID=1415555 RepID=UPI0006B01F47|nr:hypothetical protein [Streptomyces sp. WM6372]KOU24095.1 hypothetical protein ADK52_15140 [Streptomyces sp. WM6372]